jgi:hypothetical protein
MTDRKPTPEEAYEEALIAAFVSSRGFRPGVVIQQLPKKYRDALKSLTSDMVSGHIRMMRYTGAGLR